MNQPRESGQVSVAGASATHRVMLRTAAVLVVALAGIGAVVPGRAGEWLDTAAVVLVIAAPLVRVAALVVEFALERDWRFVGAAAVLLAVVAAGAVLA